METSVWVQSLASGSAGNALLLVTPTTTLAIDCGLGPRSLAKSLQAVGKSIADLDALLLTHEHADHASGLATVIAAGVQVVATAGTARAVRLPGAAWIGADLNRALAIGDMTVRPLAISHDAAEPCGFQVHAGHHVVTLLTDLGQANDSLAPAIAEADLVILEANHDVDLLRSGPYPAHLKRRVLSATGHLSNAECAELLTVACRVSPKARTIWLAHLSETNNRPALATATVKQRLAAANLAMAVTPLPRRARGPLWSPQEVRPVATQMLLPGLS